MLVIRRCWDRKTTDYSADYPGAMKRYVEIAVPGTSPFYSGRAGDDIDPTATRNPRPRQGFQAVKEMGEALGKYVVSILALWLKAVSLVRFIDTAAEVTTVKNRWDAARENLHRLDGGRVPWTFVLFPGFPWRAVRRSSR